MQRKRFSDMPCPIARALDIVGERWTLLILRDISCGIRRFDALQERLGIARNVLTQRLAWLVEQGLLEKRAYEARPPRYEYRPTEKGRGLFPVLVTLMAWGERWSPPDGVTIAVVDKDTGAALEPVLVDARTGRPLEPRAMRLQTAVVPRSRRNRAMRSG
ncbi:MAG TPA: helix-turn-helix domain-containing protein [Stellaceae bacterium]|jgi:DNA-binding HxlR family transcriptional regulator|nr:helix-turn-helix domain-containing protein [Stellaceae bacterium]